MDKIICIGKNYLEHAQELGDSVPEMPVLFLKPPSVLRQWTQGVLNLSLFPEHSPLHFETEIVLQIQSGGYNLTPAQAQSAIANVTVGLDMTLRERQSGQKKQGHPWTTSKVFPDAAIIGPWVSCEDFESYCTTPFSFELDSITRQTATGNQMRFSPAECVRYISQFMVLVPGDIVFTGTPAGVGEVKLGQVGRLNFGPIQYSMQWHKPQIQGKLK